MTMYPHMRLRPVSRTRIVSPSMLGTVRTWPIASNDRRLQNSPSFVRTCAFDSSEDRGEAVRIVLYDQISLPERFIVRLVQECKACEISVRWRHGCRS